MGRDDLIAEMQEHIADCHEIIKRLHRYCWFLIAAAAVSGLAEVWRVFHGPR